jgi:uncharacterized protein
LIESPPDQAKSGTAWRWQDQSLELLVYVQPGAKSNEVTGLHDGRIKIRLNAPPVDNRANQSLLAFVSQVFQVPKSAVSIKRGQNSRLKTLSIDKPEFLPAVFLTL